VDAADGSSGARFLWQEAKLGRLARETSDILFVPGGLYLGGYRPFVTLCHNLLPFDNSERKRYGFSAVRARLELLSWLQSATFRRATGVIFLTQAAQSTVERQVGPLSGATAVIPHGISGQFFREAGASNRTDVMTSNRPFRWRYVSIIDLYKHQEKVVEATALLHARGIPLFLDLIGPAYPPALRRLTEVMTRLDKQGRFVKYVGPVDHFELPGWYHGADGFVFASTCENMPIILLEAMAAALPIVASNRAVVTEILGDAGVKCDPERIDELANAMMQIMTDHSFRRRCSLQAQEKARGYSWERSASATLAFIARCVDA